MDKLLNYVNQEIKIIANQPAKKIPVQTLLFNNCTCDVLVKTLSDNFSIPIVDLAFFEKDSLYGVDKLEFSKLTESGSVLVVF